MDNRTKPTTRGDCLQGGCNEERPCPWVSCKWHLFFEQNRNQPMLEPWEMPETCTLDVADRGGATIDEVGAALNISRERARQLEQQALDTLSLADNSKVAVLAEHLSDEEVIMTTPKKNNADKRITADELVDAMSGRWETVFDLHVDTGVHEGILAGLMQSLLRAGRVEQRKGSTVHDPLQYRLVGMGKQPTRKSITQSVLEAVTRDWQSGAKIAQGVDQLRGDGRAARSYLQRLMAAGAIEKRDSKGGPAMYRRSPSLADVVQPIPEQPDPIPVVPMSKPKKCGLVEGRTVCQSIADDQVEWTRDSVLVFGVPLDLEQVRLLKQTLDEAATVAFGEAA